MGMPGVAVLGSKALCVELVRTLKAVEEVSLLGVVTLNDALDSRSSLGELRGLAEQNQWPLAVAASAAEAYRALADLGPSVVFVAGWYRIIPADVLDRVPQGFFGIHFSALPRYRGSAPVVWAMINGESKIGFSVFKMNEGMDEGLIACQGSVDVDETMYIDEVIAELVTVSTREIAKIASGLARGVAPLVAQPDTPPSYGAVRHPEDGRIDWTLPADQVARFVRAQSRPYPGAFALFGDIEVTIWRASADASCRYFGAPGQVVRVLPGGPIVVCANGTGLHIQECSVREGGGGSPLKFGLGSSRFH